MSMQRFATLAALLSVTLLAANASAVPLTSVDQLDLTNNVKAYNFITTTNSTFDIGGVTFTNHDWRNELPFDGLTLTDPGSLGGGALTASPITMGGTVADQTNLFSLLNSTNYSGGAGPIAIDIDVPDGNYIVQYLIGTSSNRSNELFDLGPPNASLGTFTGSGNFLITGNASAAGGLGLQLSLNPFAGGDGRPVISGLIVNRIPVPVPEPSSMLLLGFGALGLVRFTRRRRQQA